MRQVTAVVIGAGQRGTIYSDYALDFPDKLKIVGVADPREFCRERLAKNHNIALDHVFLSWEEAAKHDRFADFVIVATQDQMHRDPTVAFAEKGYHVMVEKPMATTYSDGCDMVTACQKNNVILSVCHIVRYRPHVRKLKELIDSGIIGEIVSIQLLEPVGFWHYAHSYVRGNWRKLKDSSFCLLAKSCHDIDLIQYFLPGKKAVSVSSFGGLKYFRPENKPEGAGSRCLDCAIEPQCAYSAKRLYLDEGVAAGNTGFPVKTVCDILDIENVTEALHTGPYGRCVYECDNDVVDHQVVNLQYEGGETVSFSMVAFTEKVCQRQVRIFGTKGELTNDFSQKFVEQFDFLTRRKITHDISKDFLAAENSRLQRHGGSDFYAMQAFVEAVSGNDRSKLVATPEESLMSHFLCFAAEKSRLDHCVLDLTKDVNVDL